MMSAVPYMPNITQIESQICHGVVIWRTASRPPQQIRARRPCSSLGIGIGGVVTHSPPSRPGEFRPEPLTEPDVNLSIHPARATPKRLPPCGKTMSSSGYPLTQSHRG